MVFGVYWTCNPPMPSQNQWDPAEKLGRCEGLVFFVGATKMFQFSFQILMQDWEVIECAFAIWRHSKRWKRETRGAAQSHENDFCEKWLCVLGTGVTAVPPEPAGNLPCAYRIPLVFPHPFLLGELQRSESPFFSYWLLAVALLRLSQVAKRYHGTSSQWGLSPWRSHDFAERHTWPAQSYRGSFSPTRRAHWIHRGAGIIDWQLSVSWIR